jgi:hypothetical protein
VFIASSILSKSRSKKVGSYLGEDDIVRLDDVSDAVSCPSATPDGDVGQALRGEFSRYAARSEPLSLRERFSSGNDEFAEITWRASKACAPMPARG